MTSVAPRGKEYMDGSDQVMSTLLTATIPNPLDSDSIPHEYSSLGVVSHHDMNGTPVRVPHSPPTPDSTALRTENRSIKAKVKQLQNELKNETETVTSLRRKLNTVERERIDAVAKINEEASRLDSEVTRLRAQLERGEALRQNLELELAKTRKDLAVERRDATEKEVLMGDVNEAMKSKLDELTSQMDKLCQELESNKTKAQEESSRLRETITSKEQELASYRSERQVLESEKDKMSSSASHKHRMIEELEEKIQSLEENRRDQAESLRRQIHENDFIREKEERLRKDLETAQERMHVLEENIEGERAAHLESKFNSEIVQLRLRDLEGALELEKTCKADTETNSEKLNKQIRELQKIYDEERLRGQMMKQQLEKRIAPIIRAEKETVSVNKRLQRELDEKTGLIKQLSQQLDVHTRNFDELKQELAKAKKRQAYLEETYTGSIKELEILLENFQPAGTDSTAVKTSTKRAAAAAGATKTTKKKEGGKTQTLNSLLERLRRTLIDFKHKLEDTTAELARVKGQNEHIGKEYKQYKDLAWQKDKSLESSQHGLTRTSKELRRCQADLREAESTINLMQEQLQKAQADAQQQLQTNQQLRDQMIQVASKCKSDEKTSGEFLHALYQQLKTLHPASGAQDTSVVQHWTSLAQVVSEQVTALLTNLMKANDKVQLYETTLRNKETTLAELQRSHEEQLNKLSSIAEGRSKQWEVQRADMESHYQQMLDDVQNRHKKTQALADQAWDKARATGVVQQSLETECSQLQDQLHKCQTERQSLLAACALLMGTLYPLHIRTSALAAQRHILEENVARLESLHGQVKVLVDALEIDPAADADHTKGHSNGSYGVKKGLLHFRVGVIAVMAANRMVHLGLHSCRMLALYDTLPGVYGMMVCTGGMPSNHPKFSGLVQHAPPTTPEQEHVSDWLTSEDLLSTITTATRELSPMLRRVAAGEKMDSRKLLTSARTSLHKMLSHLPASFPSLSSSPIAGVMEKTSLVRYLYYGLTSALPRLPMQSPYVSSQNVGASLQEQVLEFTQRLHTAEVERRDLRVELTSLSQQRHEWSCNSDTVSQLQQQLSELRQQLEVSVEKDKFDSVYAGLTDALQREQQAQELLNEQNHKLQQLGAQLEVEMTEGSQKEHTLTGAVQGLAESKLGLKRYEQRVRQLNRQVSALEDEKSRLTENISDAENALKTAARDRDIVSSYAKNVSKVLDSAKTKLVLHTEPMPDLRSLLSESLPAPLHSSLSKTSVEVTACRELVGAFVEVQGLIDVRLKAVQEELVSYKRHVVQLKTELNAAFQRQGPAHNMAHTQVDIVQPQQQEDEWHVASHSEKPLEFSPLPEEQNTTYIAPSNVSTPAKPTNRLSAFKTPQRSQTYSAKQRDSYH